MLKVMLMTAAATLAGAVVSNLPDQLALDPEIANPDTQAENTMAWRLTHIFYDAFLRALDPSTGWPDPPQGLGIELPALKDGGPVLTLLNELLKKLAPGGAVLPVA